MAAPKKEAIAVAAPVEEKAVETKFESPVPSILEEKPDLSRMDESSKMESLSNLLKCIPPQYLTPETIKDTVYSIARFYPSDEQIAKAQEWALNPPQRFPN